MDGWDFRSYVLGILFYRFISENLAAYLNEQERKASDLNFNYATLFIDVAAEFTRSGNKNKLLPEHQQKILEAFTRRENIEHFARPVPNQEIGKNDYNIAVSSYLEQKDEREEMSIIELNADIARIVARQSELRTSIDAIVANLEGGQT